MDALKLAHPFIKGIENVYYCLFEDETRAVSRGEIPEGVTNRTKEDIVGKDGAKTMYTTSFFVGLSIKPKEGTCRTVAPIFAFEYALINVFPSWSDRTRQARHLVSDERVHQDGEDVGEIR